jgi:WD40 repeat protein
VTIFVDALDQLVGTYAASAIHWLPRELPPGVHIVVSLLEREDEAGSCLRAAREMLPDEWLVAITPMAPEEGEQALDAWLHDARRTLGAEQKADVLGKFASCPLPLFLKLAFEEARHWKSYDGLPRGGDREPGVGRDIPGVIADLLGRLEAPTGHGQVMVSKSLRSIGAARHGLTEDEVLDVLSADEMVVEDFRLRSPRSPKVNRLPVVVWSRLFHDLEPYLTERMADSASLMAFYHRQVGEAVHGRYLSENSKPPAHQRLARYFLEQASQLDGPDGSQTPNVRRCAELPYQLSLGEMWDELLATLTDYPFLDAKLRGVNVRDLIADYERAGTAQPALPPDEVRSLRLIGDALRLSSHILIRDPDQLPSQLFGRMHDLEDAGAQRLLRETRDVVARPWLRPIKVSFTPPGGALLRTLEGHAHKVCDVALTPDGKRAVSAGGENDGSPGELMTWDLETGQRVHVLEGHTSMVWAVAVTPDGRRVVSRSADDTLRTWDLETGRLLQTLVGDFCGKIAVAKSQSGDRVLVPSSDYGIRVWDLGAGGPHLNLEGHTGDVQTVAVTQDGLRAISGSKDGTLRVWDLQTGEQLQVLESPNGRVDAVSVTPDGKRALSGAWDCVVPCLWDVETGQLLRTLESEPASGSCVAVTPDGLRALSGRDDTLRIWDLESGRELATLQEGIWHISALAVTPDSKRAVSGSWDGRLRVWDLDSQPGVPPIRKHSGFVKALSVTPDGRRAVSGATGEGAPAGNSLLVWDLDAGKVVAAPEHLTESVNAIALTPDGRRAVVGLDRAWGTREDTLRTYDLETADELPTSGTYTAWTNGVIVTPDGKLALPVSRGPLVVWDIEDGRECGRLARSGTGGVWAVAISPDGERVVCAETGSTLRVWDLATRQELFALIAHTRQIDQVGVTPDGRQVVSASNTDTRIKVWDMPARAEVHALNDHVGWVRAMAVAPDGGWAVSAAGRLHRPYELKLWDLATGSELRVFSGHADLVEALVVTPDGLRAVSASWDGTLRVWDVTTGEALCVLIAEHGLSRCAVSPDGLTVIAGDHQGYVHFLRLENVTPGPPVCTAWLSPGATFPAFGCLHCRVWSEVSEEDLGTELPCPSCGKTVKLNEFVIEADWRPVAAAWKPEE